MPERSLVRTLTALTAIMAAGEVISTVIIWREAYPDSRPWFAFGFAVLFAAATWLLRAGRALPGALLATALCLVEVASAPTWMRRNALDWSTQLTFGTVALAGLVVAVAVLVVRLRRRAGQQLRPGR